jgi:hypothetical protein
VRTVAREGHASGIGRGRMRLETRG